jgi:tryptophanyl-tRNA synthetase
MKLFLILLILLTGEVAMGNPHIGKKNGQLKVPVIKTNQKEVQNNFYGVFDSTPLTQKDMRKKYKLNKIVDQYKKRG